MVTEEIIPESSASSNELDKNVTRCLVNLLNKIDEDSQRNTSLSGRKGKRVLELKFKGTETSGESSSSVTNSSSGLVIDTESGRKLLTELLLPKDHVVDETQATNTGGLLSYVANGSLGFWMALTGFMQLVPGYEPLTKHRAVVIISVLSLLYTKAISAWVMHYPPVGRWRYGRYTTYVSAAVASLTLLYVFFTS